MLELGKGTGELLEKQRKEKSSEPHYRDYSKNKLFTAFHNLPKLIHAAHLVDFAPSLTYRPHRTNHLVPQAGHRAHSRPRTNLYISCQLSPLFQPHTLPSSRISLGKTYLTKQALCHGLSSSRPAVRIIKRSRYYLQKTYHHLAP